MFDKDFDEDFDDVKFEKFSNRRKPKDEDFSKDKKRKTKHRKPTDKDRFLREDDNGNL